MGCLSSKEVIKHQDTLDSDWKFLIVLDACRYDYFEKCFSPFLKGNLEKRKSPAIHTPEWLEKTFVDYYEDIIYISPVFWCNSVKKICENPFYGKEHFFKVINCWRGGWDEEFGTVPPWYINKVAKRCAMSYPNKRLVIHYFQPHAPYLSIKPRVKVQKRNLDKFKEGKKVTIKRKVIRKGSAVVHRTFGTEVLWRLIRSLGLEPYTNMEEAWRIAGIVGLQKAYEKNLETALYFVRELVPSLRFGKIVVTADHGELLGEKRFWGHGPPKPRIPKLTTVPWLEIEE